MRLKRRIFGVFAAVLAGVLLCGCTAAEDMQEHRTETPITIKVGSDNYPPFNYTDENAIRQAWMWIWLRILRTAGVCSILRRH